MDIDDERTAKPLVILCKNGQRSQMWLIGYAQCHSVEMKYE